MRMDIRNYNNQINKCMKTKDYLKPEIVELKLDSQQVLCMSVENFTLVEEEYEGF